MQFVKNLYIKTNMIIAQARHKIRQYIYINNVSTPHQNVWLRFMIMLYINRIQDIYLFKKVHTVICDILDVESDTFQITMNQRKVIVRAYTLRKLVEYITQNKIGYDDTLFNKVIMKFDICCGNTHINIRNYLLDYKDSNNEYDHSLENILKYNFRHNVFDLNNAKIVIHQLTRKGIIKAEYDYDANKTKHINYYL